MGSSSRPRNVARVYFQEIKAGDRRKIEGKSNDAPTGGGARDLRFPNQTMGPFFERMFPRTRRATRNVRQQGREVTEELTIHVGPVTWTDNNDERRVSPVEYWPPTHARPTEGRLGRINSLGNLTNLPPNREGRLFIVLTQLRSGEVHVRHVSEKALLDESITNRTVVEQVKKAIAEQRGNHSIRGYLDWSEAEFHPHA